MDATSHTDATHTWATLKVTQDATAATDECITLSYPAFSSGATSAPWDSLSPRNRPSPRERARKKKARKQARESRRHNR